MTLAFYAACSLYGGWKLYRCYGNQYKRIPRLAALTDAIFMFGFVVVSLDAVWVLGSALRFGWQFPGSVPQLVACLFRDVAIVALCYLYAREYLQAHATERTFYLYVANIVFMAIWFWFSPSPAYTDWTYALRNDYAAGTVWLSFCLSHIVGKTLVGVTFLSYFL